MQLISGPISQWFGYTRRERRSTLILLAIIAIVFSVRYLAPSRGITIESLADLLSDTLGNKGQYADDTSPPYTMAVSPAGDHLSGIPEGRVFHPAGGGVTHGHGGIMRPVAGSTRVQRKSSVDLNSCDTSDLAALPGIGPVLSVRIIRYRKLLGGFASVEQLKEVYGLSEETYDRIKERCICGYFRAQENKHQYSGLCRAWKNSLSGQIRNFSNFEYRKIAGRIGNIEELVVNRILAPEKAGKVRPYLDFSWERDTSPSLPEPGKDGVSPGGEQ